MHLRARSCVLRCTSCFPRGWVCVSFVSGFGRTVVTGYIQVGFMYAPLAMHYFTRHPL